MAKNEMFYVDRHTDPANPELIKADDHQLMRTYENKDDLETDIANIDDNEVVATQDNDYEGIEVVDEVVENNQNPVTSNAVYDAIEAAKIDRVKGAFVEERTNKLWTDGRPIYRQYVEGTPEPVMSYDRKSFAINVPVSSASALNVIDMYGYWEITENTSFPQIVGATYQITSSAMMPATPHNTSLSSMVGWDPRFPDRISVSLAMNVGTSYGLSEHVKIYAVIEYVKMSDTPVEDPGVGPLTPSSGNIAGVIVNDGIHYSTTETPTGSTWIDGKPIYRKTFKGIAPLTSTTAQRASYVLVLDETNLYSEIITAQGWVDWIRFYGTANQDTLRMNINFTNVSATLQSQAGCNVIIVQSPGPTSVSSVAGALYVGYSVIAESPNAPTMPYCFTLEYTKR